jgi:hypothetical protein
MVKPRACERSFAWAKGLGNKSEKIACVVNFLVDYDQAGAYYLGVERGTPGTKGRDDEHDEENEAISSAIDD